MKNLQRVTRWERGWWIECGKPTSYRQANQKVQALRRQGGRLARYYQVVASDGMKHRCKELDRPLPDRCL